MNTRDLILYSLPVYIVLLLYHGYGYGTSDQVEFIPVLKFLNDPSLYSEDFFINWWNEKTVTERTPLLHLMYWLTGYDPLRVFLLHMAFSLLLIAGLVKVGFDLIGSRTIAFLVPLIVLTIGSKVSLGGNELYYNILIGSLPAKALGVWAIARWLENENVSPYVLLSASTFFQPVVGLQLMLIIGVLNVLNIESFKATLPGSFFYLVTAVPWVAYLFLQHRDPSVDEALYAEIFEFRLAHHFFPEYLTPGNYFIALALLIAGLLYYSRSDQKLYRFLLAVFVGLMIYLSVYFLFGPTALMNTQWFKTTIWVEFFGVLAITGLLLNLTNIDVDRPIMAYTLSGLVVGFFLLKAFIVDMPRLEPPFPSIADSEMELAQWARAETEKDALFCLPLSFSKFKTHAERSCFAEYKGMIHHKDYMVAMYERMNKYYGLSIEDRRSGSLTTDLRSLVPLHQNENLENLISEGVDYIILPSDIPLAKERVFRTTTQPYWSVYELSNDQDDLN